MARRSPRGGESMSEEPITARDDRYGGVEAELRVEAAAMGLDQIDAVLRNACDRWIGQGKRGIWLRVPLQCGHAVLSLIHI